jgi:hypothetical protein
MSVGASPYRLPAIRSARLQTNELEGFKRGMIQADPAHQIPDDAARYLQDVFIHQEGFTNRRGPLTPAASVASPTNKASGFVQTTTPDGKERLAVLHGTGASAFLGVYSDDYLTITDIALPGALPQAPYYLIEANPMLNGGTLIGISSGYSAEATVQNLILWKGGNKANYTTGTITVAQAAKTVTGVGTAFLANVSPGMWLMNSSGQLVGSVSSITSDTVLELEEGALHAISGGTYTLQSLRGFSPKIATGSITASTTSPNITGANTKFRDQGVQPNWLVYRSEDNLLLGTVSSVTNNTAIVLTGNAAAAMQSDGFFILSNTPDYSISTIGTVPKVGFLNATHAGYQWFSNLARRPDEGGEYTTRVWFSGADFSDPEAVDLSKVDGDFIPVTSTHAYNEPVRAIVPAFNSLLVLKDHEAFAIYGNSPSSFSVRKVGDNGTLSTMSAVSYEGGVVWAGRDGVFVYDGVEATNITEDTLGPWYKEAVRSFNADTHRAWGFIHRDHYFLFIEAVTPESGPIKGVTATPVTRTTICIYLPERAPTLLTNVDIRGAALVARSQDAWFLVNSGTQGRVCTANALLDLDGNDSFACDGNTIGPDLYIESKKFDAGDGTRKKLFKQLMMHYLVAGDSLRLDTILGLNTIGQTSTTTWGITAYWWDKIPPLFQTWDVLAASYPTWDSLTDSVFFMKRIKFLKRSQYLAFRIYQNSDDVTAAKIGSFALGYKYQRPGRI